MNKYKQLNEDNRCEIYGMYQSHKSIRQIAKEINKNPSTISRELRRNKVKDEYKPKQAHDQSIARKKHAKKFTKMNTILIQKIELMLFKDWSPEQISGILKKEGVFISTERIYQHVWTDKLSGGTLFIHLRHGHKIRNRKRGSKDNRGHIKNKTSIHQRPEIVNEKGRIGDLEIDLIIGKDHKGFIVTVVDRVSKLLKIGYSEHKTASSILQAVVKLLDPLKAVIHTITSDNGKEFAYHEDMAKALNVKFYFADAYASWQRGLNENTNGLLRQYFPKKSNFTSITEDQLKLIENKINNRPRKTLNYLSPLQVFNNECHKLGVLC